MCSYLLVRQQEVFSVENIIDCIKHPDRGQVEDAAEKANEGGRIMDTGTGSRHFLILLFAGIPIAYILGLVALLGISQLNSDFFNYSCCKKMFTGLNSFTFIGSSAVCSGG